MDLKRGFLVLVLGLFLIGFVSSDCRLTNDPYGASNPEKTIVRLSSPTNAHGEIGVGTGGDISLNIYDWAVVCDEVHIGAYDNVLVYLSSQDNAHAFTSDFEHYINNKLDFSQMNCEVGTSIPITGKNILLSLSDETNAHISYENDANYPVKIWCDVDVVVDDLCANVNCEVGETCNPSTGGCEDSDDDCDPACAPTETCADRTCVPSSGALNVYIADPNGAFLSSTKTARISLDAGYKMKFVLENPEIDYYNKQVYFDLWEEDPFEDNVVKIGDAPVGLGHFVLGEGTISEEMELTPEIVNAIESAGEDGKVEIYFKVVDKNDNNIVYYQSQVVYFDFSGMGREIFMCSDYTSADACVEDESYVGFDEDVYKYDDLCSMDRTFGCVWENNECNQTITEASPTANSNCDDCLDGDCLPLFDDCSWSQQKIGTCVKQGDSIKVVSTPNPDDGTCGGILNKLVPCGAQGALVFYLEKEKIKC
ncbi:hypothetical protein J4481_01190 [Candidatus Pacearchaeota archaeon]|nr:hypothetical protein [Candidatus Pacearchaeota archaeon]